METIRRYMSTIRRTGGCPPDIAYQVDAWPWPQAGQSHLAIWRASWPAERGMMPPKRLRIPVINSGVPGALLRICPGAPSPREVVRDLLSGVTQ